MQLCQRLASVMPIRLLSILLLTLLALAGGIFFARMNLRLGRGDRRNATRLALFVLGLSVLVWVFRMPKVSLDDLLVSPYLAVLLWVFYMAIEPFVRRRCFSLGIRPLLAPSHLDD